MTPRFSLLHGAALVSWGILQVHECHTTDAMPVHDKGPAQEAYRGCIGRTLAVAVALGIIGLEEVVYGEAGHAFKSATM